jgi:alkanesulfonate monooxygenase SsuD/methylene tetrahydromethanopterin reductase-like flavin-dependent oxidoreductase (luciferase family)
MELGIGAGWKRDEWEAYGYGFPETKERLAMLGDHLEVITRMLDGDKHQHATWEGRFARVRDARNVPKPVQQHLPIMVGGNGRNVTWRLAAKHADELNLDGMTPDEVAEALPVIRSRCEEIGRDPATLTVSVHVWGEDFSSPGSRRVDQLAAYAGLGVSRVMGLIKASARSDEALESLLADARAAGAEIDDAAPASASSGASAAARRS